jgi:hypothetical protein
MFLKGVAMGKLISEERHVAGFDRVSLEGMGDILLEQGPVEALSLEGDEEILERISAEVSDGKLVIKYKSWFELFWHRQRIKAHLTMKDIHGISISGSGTVRASSLASDSLRLSVSGSADMDLEGLEVDDLDVHISGSGEFDLRGRATHQNLHISGSGKIEAWGLEGQDAEVHVSGSGRVTLKVQDSLDVRVSGSAEVRYLGEPKISQRISGSASVRRMDSPKAG